MKYPEAPAHRVAKVLDWWLCEEMQAASNGRNRVLDDYDGVRLAMASKGQIQNTFLLKAEGHFNRYRAKVAAYCPTSLMSLASVHHNDLMFTSGGFRRELVLSATTQEEYNGRRQPGSPGTSLDTFQVVSTTFTNIEDGILHGSDISDFILWHLAKNQEILTLTQAIDTFPLPTGVRLGPESDPMASAREIQRLGIVMAISSIAMAANLVGSYEAVPFLEPKSITDVGAPIYPLAT